MEMSASAWEEYERHYKAGYEKGRADAYRQREEADGCEGCAFMSNEEWEEPCRKCKRACKDYWRPKEQKNEHIGKRNAIQ